MAQLVEILPREGQEVIYYACSIGSLFMSCRRKNWEHQHPWYWPKSRRKFQFQKQKDWLCHWQCFAYRWIALCRYLTYVLPYMIVVGHGYHKKEWRTKKTIVFHNSMKTTTLDVDSVSVYSYFCMAIMVGLCNIVELLQCFYEQLLFVAKHFVYLFSCWLCMYNNYTVFR